MKKNIFIFLVAFSTTVFSQTDDYAIFKITAQSEVSILADLIVFQIAISEEDSDPEQAYKIHKEKESKLAELIHNLGVEDRNVSYSLLSISKSRMQKNGANTYKTNQKIKLELSDFSLYEKIQIELLKNGINEFSSIFSSTKTDEVRKKGIEKLVQSAKREAEIYAENLGLRVGKVIEIESRMRRLRGGEPAFFVAKPNVDYSLLEIPQTYSVELFANFIFSLIK